MKSGGGLSLVNDVSGDDTASKYTEVSDVVQLSIRGELLKMALITSHT